MYVYPGERMWTNPFIDGRYDFLFDGATLLDSRIYMHFYVTGNYSRHGDQECRRGIPIPDCLPR